MTKSNGPSRLGSGRRRVVSGGGGKQRVLAIGSFKCEMWKMFNKSALELNKGNSQNLSIWSEMESCPIFGIHSKISNPYLYPNTENRHYFKS